MPAPADVLSVLERNLQSVESRIQLACAQAGRLRNEVTLCAITKYVDATTAGLLAELGVTDMGESRPQVLWEKAACLPQVRWHLAGHLQRNKVERTIKLAHLIHSVDSERLLLALEDEARRQDRIVPVLLELHMTDEETKSGFTEDQWKSLPGLAVNFQRVHIQGLMGMAALHSTPEQARQVFARLRQLRDQWQHQFAPLHELRELSMGMTNDFEQAILEGATIVRIGSALFEGMPRN